MAGMRSSFEKWEPNGVAHLISMNWCGCRLQESQLQRANVKASKSVAINPRSDGFQAVMGALDGWEAVVPCHSFVIPSALPRRFRTECILRVSNVPFLD